MMKTNDPYKFVEIVKGEDLVKIYVQGDIASLCSLKMLSGLFSKEYVKHEAIFIEDEMNTLEMDDTKFVYLWDGRMRNLSNKENESSNISASLIKKRKTIDNFTNYTNKDVHDLLVHNENRIEYYKESCECSRNNLDNLINIFYLCKALNFCTEDTLWACVIPFSFYKNYLFSSYSDRTKSEDDQSDEESSDDQPAQYGEICDICSKTLNDINIEVKKTEFEKKDGLVYSKGLCHPLIGFTDIYSSLKHDIHFVVKNRLLYKKRKDIEEMKIKTYLAHKGISIKFSKEMYRNLDQNTKKFLMKNFQTGFQYFQIMKRSHVASSIDMALLMSYFLFKYKTTEAYLILNKISTLLVSKTTTRKCVEYMFEVISQIKQSLTTPIKYEELIIYKIKNVFGVRNVDYFIRFVYDIISIYIRARHRESNHLVVLDTKGDDGFVVYGVDVALSNVMVQGVMRIDKKRFLKMVFSDDR